MSKTLIIEDRDAQDFAIFLLRMYDVMLCGGGPDIRMGLVESLLKQLNKL